jgi:4-carboxymuconolactone decarboxylase
MNRLRQLHREDLDEAGQTLWDTIVADKGPGVVTAEGTLLGPFNAWLHTPALASHVVDLPDVIREKSILDPTLSELAILAVVGHWRAEFPWFAHSRMAAEHGIQQPVIDSIGRGEDPPLTSEAERVVFAVAKSLASEGGIPDDLYTKTEELLGDQGTVELVLLCGYYTMGAFVLNSFKVPLPPGLPNQWPT